MGMTDAQIARTVLGPLRSEGANVTPDDLDEIKLYVQNGFEYLEETYIYDPKQYAINAADTAVRYYAAWQFCDMRPSMVNLAGHFQVQFEIWEIRWQSAASREVNIDWMEYPENQNRVSYNNENPLNQGTDVFGVDRNRIGT